MASVLIALGVGIYQVQEPEPTCEIDAGKLVPICFADGGRRLVTNCEAPMPMAYSGPPQDPSIGPLQVWDTRTGAERMSQFAKEQSPYGAYSKDGRYFALEVEEFSGSRFDS